MPKIDHEIFWDETNTNSLSHPKLSEWIENMSFEVLPTNKALDLVTRIPIGHDIRVTCRPSGIEETIKFVENLKDSERQRAIPHLAARRISDDWHLKSILQRLDHVSVNKLFIIAGDGDPTGNSYHDTLDILAKLIQYRWAFKMIGIAGYPEGNSAIKDDPTEILLRRQDFAANNRLNMEIVTQMCFEPTTLAEWLADVRSRGVELPVRIGTVGCLSTDTLLKVVQAIGIRDSAAFLKSKPGLATTIGGNSALGYRPKEFITKLVQADSHDTKLRISGLSIFTLGNITQNLKYFGLIE